MSRKRKRPSRNPSNPLAGNPSTARDQNDTSEHGSHSRSYVDSMFVDDNGFLLTTHQVNLRTASCASGVSWPSDMPTIVKGSRAEHAISNSGTIRLSKPAHFRYSGETLIGDESENIISSERVTADTRINEPDDIAIAKVHADERNRGATLIGSTQRVTTTSVTKTSRKADKTTETHGRNGWMWCAALRPRTPDEWKTWHGSLDPAYDFVTTIHSPRSFARALAVMVANQVGPRGDPRSKLSHMSPGLVTFHHGQSVIHGPVVYTEDPYSYVTDATGMLDRALRASFCKSQAYASQREYRFVAWANQEPSEVTIDLNVSQEMLASLIIG